MSPVLLGSALEARVSSENVHWSRGFQGRGVDRAEARAQAWEAFTWAVATREAVPCVSETGTLRVVLSSFHVGSGMEL